MVGGAVKTLYGSGLLAREVMDLVPVKPSADAEEGIREIYDSRLEALFQKVKP